jgi:hypothetical protein
MAETHRDVDREYLDLLKQNYDNLHKSVWEAHRVSWVMTGIFIPILFAVIGFFIRDFGSLAGRHIFIGALVSIVVVWFWYGMLYILDRYNKTRIDQLKKIEKTLGTYYSKQPLKDFDQGGVRFKQYTLKYSVREKDKEWEHLWQAVKAFRTKISDPLQQRFEGLRFQDVTLVLALLLTIILVLAFIIA